ncbi:MAG TPA: hypothetical protein VIL64_01850 [Solirubrobacteraceae bacterium]
MSDAPAPAPVAVRGPEIVWHVPGRSPIAGDRADREWEWRTVGVFRIRAGRIAEAWLVPFDLYAFDEAWGG